MRARPAGQRRAEGRRAAVARSLAPLVDRVAAIVERAGAGGRVLVSSFHPWAVRLWMRRAAGRAAPACCSSAKRRCRCAAPGRRRCCARSRSSGAGAVHAGARDRAGTARGYMVNVWTVDDRGARWPRAGAWASTRHHERSGRTRAARWRVAIALTPAADRLGRRWTLGGPRRDPSGRGYSRRGPSRSAPAVDRAEVARSGAARESARGSSATRPARLLGQERPQLASGTSWTVMSSVSSPPPAPTRARPAGVGRTTRSRR